MKTHMPKWAFLVWAFVAAALPCSAQTNLIEDPSFEISKDRDQFGMVLAKWGGWKYEGDCDFRIGQVAHSGKQSCLLLGGAGAKIRLRQNRDLEPGRYRITAWLRGLDIGFGQWNATTEFMFDDKYMQLRKNGTFGWTKMTYVAELTAKKQTGPSFGLMAPGYFWIDDVSMEKVGTEVPLTDAPVLGTEESPIAPPGEIRDGAMRCTDCGYRNMPEWNKCFGCGTPLLVKAQSAAGPSVQPIASFSEKNPFNGGAFTNCPQLGGNALRLDKDFGVMDCPQDWTGYDFLKIDLYSDAQAPTPLYVEIRDPNTRDYWTRVNYQTVAPPGKSTLVLPIKQLYVGEKSRPGRPLALVGKKALALNINENPPGPLYVNNVRVERDEEAARVAFDGLYAFDFGTGTSPVMDGFTQITPGTLYSKGRGYGLKDARIWRAFDALQPDPLYQDFICIESGGLVVDVPNGTYHVFVNMDNPSGYWGEYQVYKKRSILAQGQPVVTDTMDFSSFKNKYFRFWNIDDMPADNTFDKYQKAYFQEKSFDVAVTNGQLHLEFQGEGFACSVAAVVIYPADKSAQGENFLKFVESKRRFYFDNYFKRTLHSPTGDPLQPSPEDTRRGYVAFQRNYMEDVYYNDTPRKNEIGVPLKAASFAGECEPVTLGLAPLVDLGKVTVSATDLTGGSGTIPSQKIDVGYVSYRLSRVTMEGTIYTISPRMIMPECSVEMPSNVTRRFWLTIKTPADSKPGLYKGFVRIATKLGTEQIPVELRVRAGKLDPVDVPAGPWGYSVGIPWPGDTPESAAFQDQLSLESMKKMREYGCTTCSGIPSIHYRGFKDGKPQLEFAEADKMMKQARDLGFLAIVSYGAGVTGFNPYYQDTEQMKAAGFTNYSDFIKAVYSEVQTHADQNNWLPVYYNLADEPLGDDLVRSAENAEAYRKAFPSGPPFFTGASSFTGGDLKNPHFRLGKALHIVDWNEHDSDGVKAVHNAGSDWALYNGGSRWTFGDYMYKAAHEYGMKFRISWHWNAGAGDPYYALDCREDDYAWCSAAPDGRLIPSIEFERVREGLDDYRRLITLDRLTKDGTPTSAWARQVIQGRMESFKLGQREHDALFPVNDWNEFREKVDSAIQKLSETGRN